MARKKQQGNGSGTIYARKNKDGKIISYRGSYFANGKRHYVSAKTKTDRLCRAGRYYLSCEDTIVERYSSVEVLWPS